MKKWWKMVFWVCFWAIASTGCAGDDRYVEFSAEHDADIGFYDLMEALTVSAAPVEERQEVVELPDVELEANILGIYEVTEDNAENQQKDAISQLGADKEYEVVARVLLSANSDLVLGQELDFLLTLPTVVEKDKKSDLTAMVFIDAVAATMDDFSITSMTEDLRLDYVPETYHIVRNSSANVELYAGDVVWNEDADWQEQTLDYVTTVNQRLGVHEYILSYHLRSVALNANQEAAVMREAEPVNVQLKGISHQFSNGVNGKEVAAMALNDCLREDYFIRESMASDGAAYLVVEVTLPDWAREYAEQYGLALTWYNYSNVPGCGIGVSLLAAFPDNYGHAEASLKGLNLLPITGDVLEYDGVLIPYPTAPLSVWYEDETSRFKNLAVIEMPTEGTEEPRMERTSFTQLLGGEIIEEIPEDNSFYVVMGTDLMNVKREER